MLRITVTKLGAMEGCDKRVAFNNGKDEVVVTVEGGYLLFGDVPHEVKCKRFDPATICEYNVEPA